MIEKFKLNIILFIEITLENHSMVVNDAQNLLIKRDAKWQSKSYYESQSSFVSFWNEVPIYPWEMLYLAFLKVCVVEYPFNFLVRQDF